MKALGIADKLIEIESSTIAKVLRPEPDYPNDKQGHNLTMDDVRAVPDLPADPIMVFKSRRREDSYVFFTERKDSKNRSIIILIAVNKRKGRIIINEITSMYGRNNEIDYVYSNAEGGYLVYMDEKRTKEWEKKTSPAGSRWHRKQYPGERATKLTGLDLNILTKERLVKFISSRQLMVSDGRTYGFVHEGKIYLDPEVMDSNVAVHEYTHLWDKYIQNTNPELWEKGKAVFKNTSLWKQVISDPAYSDISKDDDLVLSECHARISGNLAKNVLEKIAREDKKISDWSNVARVYFPIDDLQTDDKNVIFKSSVVNVPSIYSDKNNKISFKKPDNNQEDNMSSQEENNTKFSRNINADDESKTGLSDDGIIRKQPEQFEEADRDNIKQTTLNYVVQKLEKAGIEVSTDIEEFHRILKVKNHLQKMTENITGNGEEIHKINEVIRDILIKALEENAIPLTEVIYSRDNYNKIFGKGIIQSPVEEIKMGAN